MKSKITFAFIAVALLAIILKINADETVPQTQTVLKSYFQTDSIPTQDQYAELIDTMFWYVNEMYSNSVAATITASNAVAALQAVSQASGRFTIHTTDNGTWVNDDHTIGLTNNVTSITNHFTTGASANVIYTVTVTFTSNLPDDSYVVYFSDSRTGNFPKYPVTNSITSKTISNFVFTAGVTSNINTNWANIGFIVQ